MEYYTKSEGLGFLIEESRIDFRIEFRGVSILCEFNPSTKTRYGHIRTHQRPLVFHDHLVSHDRHQTTLWLHSNPSTSVPLIQRFQIQMVTNDHTTELQIIPHYPAGDDSNNTTVKTSQMDRPQSRTRPIRRSGQMSKGGFSTNLKSQRIRHGSCILPSRKLSIQKSIETKWSWMTIDDYLQGPRWPFKTVWVNHWSQIQNGAIWPRRSQQWFDKRSKRTSFQTFTFQS